jgi:dipeptidyl aminopeptidase/acylaminoacyl peptidase
VLPEDVYELVWAEDARLSPDGETAAVVRKTVDRDENTYRGEIWLVPVDASAPPRQLTSGSKLDASPRFSPDGARLAFVSNRDGDKAQLYVLPLGGGEPQKLTDLKEDVAEVVWSPDGTRIAFTARVPDPAYEETDDKKRAPRRFTRLSHKLDTVGWTGDRRRHVYVVPADGSAPASQITDGDFEDTRPTWSPDGKRIAFSSARQEYWDVELLADIFVVDATGGEPQRLTACDSIHRAPSWSPDGSLIACAWEPGGFDEPRNSQIAVVDATTGERRVLTSGLDRNCYPYPELREPLWDGGTVVFAVEDGGNTHVYRAAADGSAPPELLTPGELRANGFDAAGGTVVHTSTTYATPSELFAGDRRLTEFTREFCERAQPVEAERFTATHDDGSEVDAWIMRPHGFQEGRRYPVLLNIHGGPFTQYGTGFWDEAQVYARAGYVVLLSNPRGSSGYSEEWGRAIRGPVDGGPGWGSVDYEDLMAVVDEALRRYDFCDPDRLGVMGGSYGGYMTSWIVGHTDRFKAACSERAVNNLYSEFGSSDIGWFFKAYTGVYPFDDPEPYLRMSPVTYADSITTPMLILHSEQDLRCNIEQGEWLFSILRIQRKDVEFVRFPAESHELTRSGAPVHRVMRFELLLDWFARYLAPERVEEAVTAEVPG